MNIQGNHNYKRQIIIIGFFFFIFGFITWVNGALIPYLRIACELEERMTYLVTFAFYISYTIMAFPSGRLINKTGMITAMRFGLIIMAFGCLLFIPAALTRTYAIFLVGLFVVGIGLTLLQTAVNPYITILGPVNSAAQRISMMGIFNKTAGMLAPLLLGAIIFKDADEFMKELAVLSAAEKTIKLDILARAVILPYCLIALLLILVAYALKYAHLPEINPESETGNGRLSDIKKAPGSSMNLVMGFIAIFCAVGVEVIAGDTIGNYGLYHELSFDFSKGLTSYTLAAMMAGYILGVIVIPKFITQERAYLYCSIAGIAVTILIMIIPGRSSVFFVALLGVVNALMWPAIWPTALQGLKGRSLNRGSSVLIMGIAGGAIMPLLYGWMAEISDNQTAYWVLLPCYFFSICYCIRSILQTRKRNRFSVSFYSE